MDTKQQENQIVLAARAGFTLIEILVAVAIIGVLAAVATVNVQKFLDQSRETAAKSAVDTLKNAVTTYNMTNHKYPSSLRDLTVAKSDSDEAILEGGEEALIDPWGTEYKYERSGKKVVIISAGIDTEFGTSDDIRSDKVKNAKE